MIYFVGFEFGGGNSFFSDSGGDMPTTEILPLKTI
jgi:hypothetical protein